MPYKILVFLLVLLVSLSNFHQIKCFTSLSYPTFNQSVIGDFNISQNSYIVLGALQVTPESPNNGPMLNHSGKILYKEQFTLWNESRIASFNTTFVLNIDKTVNTNDSRDDGRGGDGLAFILAKDVELPTNSEGQWLGIVNVSTNGSTQLANIVAIEFDTKKSFLEDLDDNHVGLNINSVYSKEQVSLSDTGIRMADGADFTVGINYDGDSKVMNVSVSRGNVTEFLQIMSVPINLSDHLPSNVYVGFSASTGTGSEKNCVKSWFFNGDEILVFDKNIDSSKPTYLWAKIVPPTVIVLLCGMILGLLYRRQRRKRKQLKDEEDLYVQSIEAGLGPKKYKLKDLKSATGNFSPKNELGKGGFGVVYKGILDMKEVAVKRTKNTRQGKQTLIAEVTTIGNLRHKNLVGLIGWCFEKNELLLVYEYMPNGSLDKFIFSNDENVILNWETRHAIICGVAQSLDYLHHECSKKVLHRDIKPSNIMLDSEFNARLGDFGLARMFTQSEQTHHSTKELMGTPGYMAPESFLMGHSTAETDVYAFGVLVLVVASGKMAGTQNIVDWVWELYRSKMVLEAVDPKLKGKFDQGQAECMLVLGLSCCHPNPFMRPSMRNALQVLMGEALPPLVPLEKPVFMWPATPTITSLHLEPDSVGGLNDKLSSLELCPR